jgi:hypothetical protein
LPHPQLSPDQSRHPRHRRPRRNGRRAAPRPWSVFLPWARGPCTGPRPDRPVRTPLRAWRLAAVPAPLTPPRLAPHAVDDGTQLRHQVRHTPRSKMPGGSARTPQQGNPDAPMTWASSPTGPPSSVSSARSSWSKTTKGLKSAGAGTRPKPRKCHEIETDLGVIAVRQPRKPRWREDRHVMRGETLRSL